MLGQVSSEQTDHTQETSSAKQLAAGIAAELRSELQSLAPQDGTSDGTDVKLEHLEKYIKDLEASLSAQLKAAQTAPKATSNFQETLSRLEPRSIAFLSAIRRHHLSRTQYKKLSEGPLGISIMELRRRGLLVPTVHGSEPCYYFPPGVNRVADEILMLLPKPSPELKQEVLTELSKVGYRFDQDPAEG